MARGIARLGDRTTGTCSHPSHLTPISTGGTITKASSTVIVNGKGAARLKDEVTTDCGHKDRISSASGTVNGDSEPIARISDTIGLDGIYDAVIVGSSPDTNADD